MNCEIDISFIELKTERLLLRPFRLGDLQDFFEYASVEGVGEMAGWSHHQNMLETLGILVRFIEGRKSFAIERNGKVIGSLGIEKYNEELFPQLDPYRGRELGFVLSRDYWGQGLMPEAAKAVMDYLFEQLDLDFIMAGYFKYNSRSQRVQEKLGFHPFGQSLITTQYGTKEETVENIIWRKEYYSNGKE